jgi:AcrR family transcriptional regulator
MERTAQKRKTADFEPKKLPTQERARQTFDAVVDACTWLLPRRGYAGTTTNHIAERAGVNIASLYEYFPGKDAVIAQVAERLVQRVLGRLAEGIPAVLESTDDQGVRLWIRTIYETMLREKELVAVFQREVPYTSELESMRTLGMRLLQFSQNLHDQARPYVRDDINPATIHLLNNLVSSTILQVIQAPPGDVSRDALLDELAVRIGEWVRPRA